MTVQVEAGETPSAAPGVIERVVVVGAGMSGLTAARALHVAGVDVVVLEGRDRIGVAQGLAYTEYGGSLMLVEVSVSKGKGKLLLTGKLGEVMQESAQAAYSFLRSRSEELGIEVPFWEEKDVHVHVPEGAVVPRDGSQSGIHSAGHPRFRPPRPARRGPRSRSGARPAGRCGARGNRAGSPPPR